MSEYIFGTSSFTTEEGGVTCDRVIQASHGVPKKVTVGVEEVDQIRGQKQVSPGAMRCLPAWWPSSYPWLPSRQQPASRPHKRHDCGESLRERGPINSQIQADNNPRLSVRILKGSSTMGTTMTNISLTKYPPTHLEFISRAGGTAG